MNMTTALFCVLLATGVSRAFGADLMVGTATARAGQKTTGFLQVPAGVDAATEIPVILIQGAKPGPKLALVAGSHGTEYASIIALEKLAQTVNPAELGGTVIIVPLVNLASFAQKVPHVNPVDGKNMNRLFPGKADGTQTERALWAIGRQVVEQCDYLIDLHGGDLDENLRRYSYWPQTGNEKLDAASRAMVLAFGLDHVIIQKQQTPAVAGATSISRFAVDLGKPTVIAEAGHAGTTESEDVDALVRGSENVMRQLKMLPGGVKPVEHPVWLGQITTVKSEQEGIFYPLVVPEDYVQQGMRIGYTTDYFGNKVADVITPLSGVVVYICSVPSMAKGGTAAYIAEIAAAP
ncbi:MAG: succinylglutamate desuccinylase/aspartoacylase family protein [Acidobacteriaceae bacterium]|nr:succinylglutamate desuccinylase/aspartoacylase family protein [Acidobacteriaceae bacterium]